MLSCSYPVPEALSSGVRRYLRHQSPGQPDSAHLHSLIKTELIRPMLAPLGVPTSVRNAAVSPILWAFTSLPTLAAVALFDRPALLGLALVACALLYHLSYRYLAQRQAAGAPVPGTAVLPPYGFGARLKQPRHRARARRPAVGR